MVIETSLLGALEMFLLAVPAMVNQQGIVLVGHQTQAASDLITIHHGQANIEQYHFGFENAARHWSMSILR